MSKNEYSFFIAPQIEDAEKYKGQLKYNGVNYNFGLKKQFSGKYLYRGSITIFGSDGSALKVKSAAAKEKEANDSEEPSIEEENNKYEYVSADLYVNDRDLKVIEAYIKSRGEELFIKNYNRIMQSIDIQTYKNTITPAYAALRYSEAYVLYKHAKSYNKATVPMPKEREKLTPYQKRLVDSIIKLSAGLPIKPMAEISGREIAEYIKSNNLTDDNVRELRNFWMYCRDRGVYSGGNPFPETKSSKRTRQGAMRGAFVANELSDDQIDESFELIMQHPGGENCAVGLQLWAGLDVKTVVALRWKDVVFHDNADFTTIILLQNDNAVATHIYTRPILPQASRMLHMMHDIATECGDTEEINESFVVCKDNGKPFTADEIVKSTKRFIKNLDKDNRFSTMKGTAVAMSTRIMNNTYRGILIRKCGLTDDTYTFKFLCGESLSTDVSSDHYISFTDKDAQARLFALLKVAGPVQSFQSRMEEIDEGEYVRYRIYPPTTAHTAVLNAKLVFENAESFTIESEHGVTGDLTVRRIDENGKKKRKPRKKKKTDGQNDDENNS